MNRLILMHSSQLHILKTLLSEYIIDDSILINKSLFHNYNLESIQVPTSTIGNHKIQIKQYLTKFKIQNIIYNYEVIENK